MGALVVTFLPLIVISHRVADAVNLRGVRGVASWLGHFNRFCSSSSRLKLAVTRHSLGRARDGRALTGGAEAKLRAGAGESNRSADLFRELALAFNHWVE